MTKAAMRRVFVVLLAALVAGATLPALTSAASHKSHQSRKHKKKKHKKVKVKCAATVTCPEPAGPTGPQGPQGTAGATGATTNASVRQRVRTTGAQTTAFCDDSTPSNGCPNQQVTLTNNTWTQPVGEFEFLGGVFNISTPNASATGSGCQLPGPQPGRALIQVVLDGNDIGDRSVFAINGATQTLNFNLPFSESEIPSPASSANHTLQIKISDDCPSGGAAGQGGHFILNSAAADVVAFG